MTIREYQENAKQTNTDLGSLLNNNLHMLLGLTTEVGELADVFKKQFAYKKEIDWVNVKEELGDVMWYIANFCEINGIDLEECMGININKLRVRYPGKFNHLDALNRNLEKEREILESKK